MKTMKNGKFKKRSVSLKNSSPDSEADFSEKSLLGVWRLRLSKYDITLHIYHTRLNILVHERAYFY